MYIQKTSITRRPMVPDKDVPHNMGKKDVIRASDFNFLQVLGKGSFGKVRVCIFILLSFYIYRFV